MGAGGSSEASVPGGPPVAGSEPGAAGAAGGGAQWGAFVVLLFLGLLVAYCCWGAPCCRGCCCRPRKNSAAAAHPRAHEDSGVQAEDALGSVCTPTIILLPQGRMLVVDGAVLSSLQADASGLDLIRLGENLVRAQRRQDSSILDAESGLAGLAGLAGLGGRKEGQGPRPLDGGPPTYDELFGEENERAARACLGTTASTSPRHARAQDGTSPVPASSRGASPCSTSPTRSVGTRSPVIGSAVLVVHPPTYEELLDQAQAACRLFPGPTPSPTPSTPVGDGALDSRTDSIVGSIGDSLVGISPPASPPTERTESPSNGDGDQSIRESRV